MGYTPMSVFFLYNTDTVSEIPTCSNNAKTKQYLDLLREAGSLTSDKQAARFGLVEVGQYT